VRGKRKTAGVAPDGLSQPRDSVLTPLLPPSGPRQPVDGVDRKQTPKKGWPPCDASENYSYSAVAPPIEAEDEGIVPPLVLRARQMGLGV
jgi:hypothetical protein